MFKSPKFVSMKTFVDKYIVQNNIWVATCFTGLLLFFQLSFFEVLPSVLGIVFFGTLAVYNFTRIGSVKDFFQPESLKKTKVILTYIGAAMTIICLVIRGFDVKTFMYLGVLGFISFCYVLPFSGLGLRFIPFIKLFLIGFIWAGSSIGLLLVVHHELVQYKLLFLSVFFFVVGITIPFDIRDEPADSPELKTVPMLIGFRNSKRMALLLLILSGLFFYIDRRGPSLPLVSWWVALIFAAVLIVNTHQKKSFFYFSFWVESCSLIPLLAYLILNSDFF